MAMRAERSKEAVCERQIGVGTLFERSNRSGREKSPKA
jgi:hypothetical protein